MMILFSYQKDSTDTRGGVYGDVQQWLGSERKKKIDLTCGKRKGESML